MEQQSLFRAPLSKAKDVISDEKAKDSQGDAINGENEWRAPHVGFTKAVGVFVAPGTVPQPRRRFSWGLAV